jgi:hypothetical protein
MCYPTVRHLLLTDLENTRSEGGKLAAKEVLNLVEISAKNYTRIQDPHPSIRIGVWTLFVIVLHS